jgi:hypothetical protein
VALSCWFHASSCSHLLHLLMWCCCCSAFLPAMQLAKGPIQVGLVSGNSIKIRDVQAEAAAGGSGSAAAAAGGEPDALMAADEDMARRLQAKMDAQSMGVGK